MENRNEITPKQAMRRYFKVFVPSMVSYLVFIFLAAALIKRGAVGGVSAYILALLPVVSVLVFIWAHFRLISEVDELHRRVQMEAMLIGVGGLLVISASWGLIELLIKPEFVLPFFYAFPIYFVLQGMASAWLSRKYGTAC